MKKLIIYTTIFLSLIINTSLSGQTNEILVDNFIDDSGNWSLNEDKGSFFIINGFCILENRKNDECTILTQEITVNHKDYVIEASIDKKSDVEHGIILDFKDANNFLCFSINTSNNTISLKRKIGGIWFKEGFGTTVSRSLKIENIFKKKNR